MRNSMIPKLAGLVFAAMLATSAAITWAEDANDMTGGYGPGYGMGPGMGMMGGGYGMGPGMMGGGNGYGMGPGMGMMGGYGQGPGMMGGGYGGMGMMGGSGWMGTMDLSDDQRTKINKTLDGERKQHWAIMGKMMDEQNKLRDLYAADKPDPKKVGAVYGEIAKLQQQMIETHLQATNQVQDVLTKEQREQIRQWHRGGWCSGPGPRGPAGGQRGNMAPGNMPGNMMGR